MQNKIGRLATHYAHWHDHVNHVCAPKELQHWLTDRGSLTAKLIAHSEQFRVQRLFQQSASCWPDEYAEIGMPKAGKAHAREVLLLCNDIPVVFAHTVLPLNATASQWPLFRTLGNKSLGSTLFGDPLVARGAMQFARLQPNHPAVRRARGFIDNPSMNNPNQPLYARRSLFYRRGGVMLVTELFLPSIALCTVSTNSPHQTEPR